MSKKAREKLKRNNRIIELYNKGITINQLAERFGLTRHVITNVLKKEGLYQSKPKKISIDKDLLYQKYIEEELSLKECASLFDVSYGSIRTRLLEYNIPIRGIKESLKIYDEKNPNSWRNKQREDNKRRYERWKHLNQLKT